MRIFFLSIVLFVSFSVKAQVFYRRSEFGLALGAANYYGDLNQNYSFKGLGYTGGVFYRYNFTHYIALKLALNTAHIGFDDKYSSNYYQQQRNLNFQTNIYEGTIQTEFSFFQYTINDFEHRFSPYVTLGMGVFRYDPYTTLENKRYYLRPLGTEGQGLAQYNSRKYTTTAVSFPIGMGIKIWLSKGMTLSLEAVDRVTTTDYLDDVSTTYVGIDKFQSSGPNPYPSPAELLQDRSSEITTTPIGVEGRQRGISSTKDQFMFFQVGFSFRLPTYKCPKGI